MHRSILDGALERATLPSTQSEKPAASRPPPLPPPPKRHEVRDHVNGRFVSVRNGRVRR